MSVAVPDRRVKAPKPERGRRDVTGVMTYGAPSTEPADDAATRPGPGHRELRWVRHRNDWFVELVVVVPDGSGLPPV